MNRAQIEQALGDPRVLAFLDMISRAEGTHTYGYYTLVGGSRLSSLAQHPNRAVYIPSIGKNSTAAGRYQFLYSTWSEYRARYGLTDFGPRSQDIAAVALMNDCGALRKLILGDFIGAVGSAGTKWASLPGSTLRQRTQSLSFVTNVYQAALQAHGGAIPPTVASNVPVGTVQTAGTSTSAAAGGDVAGVAVLAVAAVAVVWLLA
jgi:muramidase (phage lysozyme)